MMTKTIADGQCWRAELTVGTREGYKGDEVVSRADLLAFVEAYMERPAPWYAVIVWSTGSVIGPTFPVETVYKISLENNPLYTPDATEEQVRAYAIHLADYLAVEFRQVRIYVALYPIRSMIVDTTA